jgi:hypothetical protein
MKMERKMNKQLEKVMKFMKLTKTLAKKRARGADTEKVQKQWNKKCKAATRAMNQITKSLREKKVRDRDEWMERSRSRQQLSQKYCDKSNNWKKLHGLQTKRKY